MKFYERVCAFALLSTIQKLLFSGLLGEWARFGTGLVDNVISNTSKKHQDRHSLLAKDTNFTPSEKFSVRYSIWMSLDGENIEDIDNF